MLIVALVLAVIALAALVTAVVTSNEMIAWVCIGASGLGVLLLVFDAIRDRTRRRTVLPAPAAPVETTEVIAPVAVEDEIDYAATEFDVLAEEDHPDEIIHDEPDYDTYSDDEAEFPEPAEEAAVHTVSEEYIAAESSGGIAEETIADETIAEETIAGASYADSDETVDSSGGEDETGYPATESDVLVEDHPDEIVHDEPDYDTLSDDEAEFPEPAEEAAVHIVGEETIAEAAPVEVLSAEAFVTEVRYSSEPVGQAETPAYTHVQAEDVPSYTYVEADEGSSYTYVEADETGPTTDEHRDR